MDKKIAHSSRRKNILRGAVALAIGLILCSGYIFQTRSSKTIDRSSISTTKVLRDEFQEIISFSAVTEPVHSVDLSITEGGKVTEIAVQNGDTVHAGDILIRLENPDLRLDFMQRETQIIEQINALRNARMTLETAQRSDEEALLDLAYQLQQVQRQFKTDTLLYGSKVIAENDYRESQIKQDYYRRKMGFLQHHFDHNRDYRSEQLGQIDASIALMQRNLDAITKHLENLTVKAPSDGILTNFDLIKGASLSKNQTIARIEEPANYKAVASIDEHYIHHVREGLRGTFKLNGETQSFEITKIYPNVVNSSFQADITFDAGLSALMTKGQTLNVKLPISDNRQALLIEKGDFYQSAGGTWVYVLEGDKATRRDIVIGKQNDRYYEVISGLSQGEVIINSSYAGFEEVEEIYVH